MWITARDGAISGGTTETWLTTGNDITFNDAGGNQVAEHHAYDTKFFGDQIKWINAYSRLLPKQ